MKHDSLTRIVGKPGFAGLALAVCGCSTMMVPDALDPEHAPKTGQGWIKVFNGKDLSGWHARNEDRPMSWKVADGVMINTSGGDIHGTDIVSDRTFRDYEIYYEYRIPPGNNSGMYFRGLYEVQMLDDYGKPPSRGGSGGIWATADPALNASKPAGEWQSVFARIVGQTVETVVLNGMQIHENVKVPKPTGGDLRKEVGMDDPGPVMIQGDHGSVEVRCVLVRPMEG